MVKNFLRILVCPLDWGLGHATRCVPIINELLRQNHEVILAADGKPYDFLRDYFPDLELIRFPGVMITYPEGKTMIWKMIAQAPSILSGIYREHHKLKRIISEIRPDVVISDNRFGLWSKNAYSVYMTHQVMIKAPAKLKWTEPLLYRIHRWFINHYDECWIPDLPGATNLSGDLSHFYPLPKNAKFIGLLSRFEIPNKTSNPQISKSPNLQTPKSPNLPISQSPNLPISQSPNLLVLISGPEPQRSIFEQIIYRELEQNQGLKAVILQGLPGDQKKFSPFPGVDVYNHLPDEEIAELIAGAGVIICRPGYSTLMDLAVLGRNAVLVPTPGQTEQEYLAASLSASGTFSAISQEHFSLDEALEAGRLLSEKYLIIENDEALLKDNIINLSITIREKTRE